MRAFYNEIDRYCCDWLQNLMDAGHITPGKIDDRSIADLSPDDVRGYERVHFFAGIAGWELALTLSGYDGPLWTGSCPCQPFSAAGKGKASSDERHLWPIWFELIRAIRPPVIFGEQVEAAVGWGWLDLVHSDMEAEGYTIRSAVLPACSVGAPHIRQRLWFVGHDERNGSHAAVTFAGSGERLSRRTKPTNETRNGELADSERARLEGPTGALVQGRSDGPPPRREPNNPWHDLIWLPCTDGKQRPTGWVAHNDSGRQLGANDTGECGSRNKQEQPARGLSHGEPGQGPTQSIIQPLAHGVPSRVAKLRAIGNAICPQVCAEFIKAAMTDA